MKHHKNYFLRGASLVVLAAIVATQAVFPIQIANAAQITTRKLTLQAGATDGGSKIGGTVRHFFEFTVPSTTTAIGSIKFEYCTTAANSLANPTCVKPAGLSTLTATLGAEGANAAGFDLINTVAEGATDGNPYLSRTAANPSGGSLSYRLDSVVNPSTEGTFFVRISTYTSTDTTGTATDSGTVTASTTEQIILDGTMPESLVFCTGETISLTASVPDCSTATDGIISFNQLFSPTDTAIAKSQMAASTNAGFGYAITVNGTTLTSGSNTITANATPVASLKGNSQFGMNLRANTTAAAAAFSNPGTSSDIAVASNGTNYNGRPLTDYASADTFTFVPGAVVADSNFDATGSPNASDAQIFTASYIVNVPGSQAAGTYTTTLTYICTPTF